MEEQEKCHTCCDLYGKIIDKLMKDKSLIGVILGTLIFLGLLELL